MSVFIVDTLIAYDMSRNANSSYIFVDYIHICYNDYLWCLNDSICWDSKSKVKVEYLQYLLYDFKRKLLTFLV